MNKSKGKVLIAAPVHQLLIDGLAEAGYYCVSAPGINQAAAPALLADCVGVITSTRLQLDKELLDAAPFLKWIGRMGSGMEVIDVGYAVSKGIRCFGSPEGNCNAVGEHALGMLLSLIRRIVVSNEEVKDNVWLRDENRGIELEGKTIGIIGFGHTGRSFARKLSGFDMQILAYDKYDKSFAVNYVEKCDTLERIYKEADIISFHVPLQPDTKHYFNNEFVGQMSKPFILINTSRGQVVDTLSLYDGIKSNKIIGACLDVFETEPISAMTEAKRKKLEELIQLPQLVVTPHIAGYTHEALYKMSLALLKKAVLG